MRRFFLLLFSLVITLPVFGQRDETMLSNPRLKFTGAWFSSSMNTSHLGSFNPEAVGGIIALEFNKDYLFGWEDTDWKKPDHTFGDIHIRSKSLYLGYAHEGYKVIHPIVGLSVGRARIDADGHATVKATTSLASIGAEFNIFRWFKLGGELGYRHIVSPEKTWLEEHDLSGPYAAVRLKFGWSWGR